MSTDAGNAAAPEDSATREVSSERPGLESGDPGAADSATSTPESADRGVEGSGPDGGGDSGGGDSGGDGGAADADTGAADSGGGGADQANEGFLSSLVRDSTVTGLPGETGAPPAEPHAPQAQQQSDEPVGDD